MAVYLPRTAAGRAPRLSHNSCGVLDQVPLAPPTSSIFCLSLAISIIILVSRRPPAAAAAAARRAASGRC